MEKDLIDEFWEQLEKSNSDEDLVDMFYEFYGEEKDREDLILGLAGVESNPIEEIEARRLCIEKLRDQYSVLKEKQKETLVRFKYRRK